jgi:catalase-peroxidase
LHQHGVEANPLGPGFDYADAFARLDLAAVKRDLRR